MRLMIVAACALVLGSAVANQDSETDDQNEDWVASMISPEELAEELLYLLREVRDGDASVDDLKEWIEEHIIGPNQAVCVYGSNVLENRLVEEYLLESDEVETTAELQGWAAILDRERGSGAYSQGKILVVDVEPGLVCSRERSTGEYPFHSLDHKDLKVPTDIKTAGTVEEFMTAWLKWLS